jgi:4-hydroxy-2-oxoheptanedioate aldolase
MHANGVPSFGLIATIPSVQTVQILARSGLDWLLIDMEHGPIDLKTAHAMVVATGGTPAVPFVRVATTESWLVKQALDLGVLGVGFPMINSGADAAAAVRALKYPPQGSRQWGPFYAPMRWGVTMSEYIAAANDDVLTMITIEHPEAVRNIDEIMSTPGIDLAIIGPGDLATALELPNQFDHPRVKAAIAEAEAGILRSGIPLGGAARTPEQAKQMVDRGYRAIGIGFDWMLLQQAAAGFMSDVRKLIGRTQASRA